jgi:hypothetical protein
VFAVDDPSQEKSRNDPPVVESGTEARQGRWGRQVFLVLVAGLLLAMIAWVVLEMWGENIDEDATQSFLTVPPRIWV